MRKVAFAFCTVGERRTSSSSSTRRGYPIDVATHDGSLSSSEKRTKKVAQESKGMKMSLLIEQELVRVESDMA